MDKIFNTCGYAIRSPCVIQNLTRWLCWRGNAPLRGPYPPEQPPKWHATRATIARVQHYNNKSIDCEIKERNEHMAEACLKSKRSE